MSIVGIDCRDLEPDLAEAVDALAAQAIAELVRTLPRILAEPADGREARFAEKCRSRGFSPGFLTSVVLASPWQVQWLTTGWDSVKSHGYGDFSAHVTFRVPMQDKKVVLFLSLRNRRPIVAFRLPPGVGWMKLGGYDRVSPEELDLWSLVGRVPTTVPAGLLLAGQAEGKGSRGYLSLVADLTRNDHVRALTLSEVSPEGRFLGATVCTNDVAAARRVGLLADDDTVFQESLADGLRRLSGVLASREEEEPYVVLVERLRVMTGWIANSEPATRAACQELEDALMGFELVALPYLTDGHRRPLNWAKSEAFGSVAGFYGVPLSRQAAGLVSLVLPYGEDIPQHALQ